LLSIIIPTKNRAKYLERCLRSIFDEIAGDYPDTEVIVVDGGSTDATLDTLRKYERNNFRYVSELDSGPAEAVNKGIDMARGHVIRFLGDDDEIVPGSTARMMRHIDTFGHVHTVFGQGIYQLEDARGTQTPLAIKQPLHPLSFGDFLKMPGRAWTAPEMQFTRRWVFDRFGGYDERYKFLGCLDMWLRHTKGGVWHDVVGFPVTRRILTPASGGMRTDAPVRREMYAILKEHGGWQAVLGSDRNPLKAISLYLNINPRAALKKLVQ
jgi:glycosyltransferase involved in cell wall biosynthesis